MNVRALTRLGVVSVSAAGTLVLAGHLAAGPTAPVSTAATSAATASAIAADAPRTSTRPGVVVADPVTIAAAPPATREARPATARVRLQQALQRHGAGSSAPSRSPHPAPGRPVDEGKPHPHLPDPEKGGLVPVKGATGVVGDAADLGPVHVDPMPVGVSLSDPTDTDTLLDRASLQQPVLAASADDPFTAGAGSPVGTPGISVLSRHLAPSCSGTGVDGNRVQVLYVHQAATRTRYAQVLPILRNEVANVDDVFGVSAQQTGGQRRVRWVHTADCQPVIKDVTVPNGALGRDFWGTIAALRKLGYTDPRRKYLIFADANQLCGIGTMYDDPRPTYNPNDGSNASYARVDAGCWSSGHSVPAHELTHNLGGVLRTAPHGTVYGHCFDESDLMCYDDGSGKQMRKVCASAQEQLLDCNHDDYFHTRPAAGTFLARNWNTARSSFLDSVVPPTTGPVVVLRASATTARTGQRVTLTATSTRTVAWSWTKSASGSACALTPGTSGRADLLCPSTVSGAVTVTATGTEAGTAAKGTGQVAVAVAKAAAPTARVSVPATTTAGSSFTTSVSVTGTAPFTYRWSAGTCRPVSPTSGYTAVTCPSATPSQSLPVSVLVTQADGQRVSATALVPVRGVASAAIATRALLQDLQLH